MSSSEVGPTENVVQALLEYFVDPMLPLKSAARETPSLSQQQLVAKQVHAVVLLYNYYHRKRHREVEFLSFESFCKLAVTMKPTLLAHLKLMHNSDYTELDDLENHLSLTEKAIMNACDIALVLDASEDAPSTEGWPISKVAVLLVDSKKENCFLQFSSVTHGVWSLIEKDIDISKTGSGGSVEGKYINKRKRFARKPLKNGLNADEAGLQQVAYSAIKEATGLTQTDLVVLESHVVYSLSKEKTAAQFYIIQCTQPSNEDLQVIIKDAIESSLQGPLVKKSSNSWILTPVAEHFHMLPYAGIVSEWLSRGGISNNMQCLKVGLGNVNVSNPQRTTSSCDLEATDDKDHSSNNCVVEDSIGNETKDGTMESPKQKDNGHRMICLSESLGGRHDIDVGESCNVGVQNKEKNKNTGQIIKVYHHQRKTTTIAENAPINGLAGGAKVKIEIVDPVKKSSAADCKNEESNTGNKICSIIASDQDDTSVEGCALFPSQSKSIHLEKLQVALASKENALTQTALRVLLQRRDKLSRHLRSLEDEIAICDKHIQTIKDGGEDDLAVKLEAIINGCNDVSLNSGNQIQESSHQHAENQGLNQYAKRKRLSEAILTLQSPCQQLDGICHENNWRLPTYSVSPSDGGFLANVIVKGIDFEYSGWSDVRSSPREARESVAEQMIAKLRSMAGQTQ